MTPEIKLLSAKKLIGKSTRMSLAINKTPMLWKAFMTERKSIQNTIGTDLYSIQVYDHKDDFRNFTPQTEFEKWAVVEVENFDGIPENMKSFVLPKGMYAVFIHKGTPAEFQKTFQYIFGVWLPSSEYLLDDRPHFELLGEKYKNNSPDSEEEVWIPVKEKIIVNSSDPENSGLYRE